MNFNMGVDAYRPSLNSGLDLIKSEPTVDRKSYVEPPIVLMQSLNYKDKPSSLTYNTLYQMATKNSVVGAVINTRVNQVSSFTKPARFNKDKLGYEIRLRNPTAVPTDEQTRMMIALETFIENCGYKKDNTRDDFDQFIRKVVRDSLTYDQLTFEIIPDRRGLPAEFLAVDASTIRAASEDFHFDPYMSETPPKSSEEVSYVQVIDGTVVSWFTANELAFGIRNPRTSIYMQPYGFSELEQLITQITSHLYAEEYNSKFFSQGGTTKGIINLKQDPNGVMSTQQLESFKRQWRAQVTGMTGAWKTPVVQIPNGIEYVNVSQSNREMEFEKWMNYLINIVCAVYQIDPAEVNFPNNGGVAGTGGGIFESSNESKLKNSKDKGLRPLLRFIESLVNKHIVSRFSEDFVFNFTGIDEKSEDEEADFDSKTVKVYRTVNEIRADHGKEPLPNGDIILDPSYLNYIQQKEAQEQQASQMGAGAMGVEENPDFSVDDTEEEPTEETGETEENSEEDYSGYEEPESDDYSEYTSEDVEKSLLSLEIDTDLL
jgi:HK97 family phage portal protein